MVMAQKRYKIGGETSAFIASGLGLLASTEFEILRDTTIKVRGTHNGIGLPWDWGVH